MAADRRRHGRHRRQRRRHGVDDLGGHGTAARGFAIVARCTPPPSPPRRRSARCCATGACAAASASSTSRGEAEVSTRHLSYLETGRAEPSREMVLRLADRLDVPLRERNRWLAAAGFAPMFAERRFDDPALAAGRAAIELVLKAHEPWPALAVDRHWAMVAHNAVVPMLIAGCAAELLQPPVNVLRLSLHPEGLAPRIANLREWRAHLLARLDRQIAGQRRRGAGSAARGAEPLSAARGRPGRAARRRQRRRRPPGVRQPARPALVHQHDDGVRHAERRARSRSWRWRPSSRPTRRRRPRCAAPAEAQPPNAASGPLASPPPWATAAPPRGRSASCRSSARRA